jgi:hypothetical protein
LRICLPVPDRQHKVLLWSSAALRENIQRKWPGLWCAKNWILHDDNAPCHRALLVRKFLANHNMWLIPHLPYSPGLAPADFFLFPKMKMQLKGRHFHTVAEIQRELQTTTRTHAHTHTHTHTHTHDHKNTNIATTDVNIEMSLGTLPYQDWRSL